METVFPVLPILHTVLVTAVPEASAAVPKRIVRSIAAAWLSPKERCIVF